MNLLIENFYLDFYKVSMGLILSRKREAVSVKVAWVWRRQYLHDLRLICEKLSAGVVGSRKDVMPP